MPKITLGSIPHELDVPLTPGADWHAGLRAEVAGEPVPWPAGTVITLHFTGGPGDAPTITWPAALDSEHARWARTEIDVAAVKAAGHLYARLTHTLGAVDTVWAAGRVRWNP